MFPTRRRENHTNVVQLTTGTTVFVPVKKSKKSTCMYETGTCMTGTCSDWYQALQVRGTVKCGEWRSTVSMDSYRYQYS